MASPASTAEIPTFSKTLDPTPAAHQESLDPRIIVALFEIGSLPPLCWDSLPSPKNSSHQVTEQDTAQKFENLLKEIKDILKNVAGFGEQITEAKESFEEIYISGDVSELKEKIRELGKINKMLLKNVLISLDPEKEQNAKKQKMSGKHLENQNSKNMEVLRKDVVNHSEEKRAPNETQLNEEKAKYGFLPVQEESIKLRNNMEQLLQEAEHWSKQHTELSELIKLYQKSQKDAQETLENNGDYFQTQPNNEVSGRHELEEQVRKLSHDTYSLHLIAALLENECQILQQRVEILKELQHQKEQTLQEKPIQINYEQNKKEQEPSEAEKAENYKQSIQETEGTFQKKDGFYRSLDACLNKKARNNWFNTRIARRARMGKKRPSSSLR
ncbi:PREDICTED: spermatogenic leucine zipper protein 1 [Galeopterus variegatus]|uniref:Spermatogenic leucine zipper protein 1 n=1 Tax=Galeopterus variegatus TaxID=482537 RepID=A0ABM0S300_GALVR|nr:PREDICTED: spermatogenic leucine zipper protein 1 [Galeopterus variegatus]